MSKPTRYVELSFLQTANMKYDRQHVQQNVALLHLVLQKRSKINSEHCWFPW